MEKNNNIFNEEEKFEKLRNLLSELPKEKVPDNFEYNLMTRVHNKNFDIKSERKTSKLFRIYTPTFALAASVALIFFLFSEKDINNEDPWNTQPKLRPEMQTSEALEYDALLDEETNVSSKPSEEILGEVKKDEGSVQMEDQRTQNNIAAKKTSKPNFPFDKRESVDLDKMLSTSQAPSVNKNIKQPQLTGGNESPSPEFGGFFLRQKSVEVKKDSLKAADSLKQLQDSLNGKK
ncbi:MAG: hypothetical protein ABFS12_09665 [Bacteroidota bacterium]